MDVWLTYRLLPDDDGPGGECEAGPAPDGNPPLRGLFTFPEPEPGFDLNGKQFEYGPTIGEMYQAIRERHGGQDSVILRTEFPEDVQVQD